MHGWHWTSVVKKSLELNEEGKTFRAIKRRIYAVIVGKTPNTEY